MVDIAPFRGIRYNPQIVNIKDAVAPPYDVIEEEELKRLHSISPYNITRVTLPEDGKDKYLRAAEIFEEWLKQKVLLEEERPSLYIYRQSFKFKGEERVRTGIMARVRLCNYEEGVILPHEKTMRSAREDRLALLRTTFVNMSPVFAVYQDEDGRIKEVVEKNMATAPLYDFVDDDGQEHIFWRVDDGEDISHLIEAFADKRIFIADGHHRYETALTFRDELRKKSSSWTGEEGANYVLMYLADVHSPGMVILSAHRVLRGIDREKIEEFLKNARQVFRVEELNISDPHIARKIINDSRDNHEGVHIFGMYLGGGRYYKMVLESEEPFNKLKEQGRIEVSVPLDVAILHELVFEDMMGLCVSDEIVSYIVDEERAMQEAEQGAVAFLLNPTTVEQVMEIARRGERMPGKATYFYPKVLTGLVMYSLKEPAWSEKEPV